MNYSMRQSVKFLLSLITRRRAPFDERVEQIILNSLSNDNVSDRPLRKKNERYLYSSFTSRQFRAILFQIDHRCSITHRRDQCITIRCEEKITLVIDSTKKIRELNTINEIITTDNYTLLYNVISC